MAIRERKGRASPRQVYWHNPYAGKRESANFAAKKEALKEDSLVKHRLKFERESFRPVEQENAVREEPRELTLEQAYFLYLREKQFSRKSLSWQMDAMRIVLSLFGDASISAIWREQIKEIVAKLDLLPIKRITKHNRLSVFRTVMN